MPGGMVFTAADVTIRDQYGLLVMCTRCGGMNFDVTVGLESGDRVECANADCGHPAGVPADQPAETAGR